jgi:DNA replication protein DnaC
MQSQVLRNVPKLKLELALKELEEEVQDESKKMAIKKAFHRYWEANIPVKYWKLEMKLHFKGDLSLMDEYNKFANDIKTCYKDGRSVCFAGRYGIGKTLASTNILKRALESGFNGLYLNLNDIIASVKSKEYYLARKELISTDFLIIDEFDPRYIASDNASDFYGRTLEDILRNRSQNRLPLIMCTNSPNPVEAFNGAIKESVSSLMNYVDVVAIIGKDYRPSERK